MVWSAQVLVAGGEIKFKIKKNCKQKIIRPGFGIHFCDSD